MAAISSARATNEENYLLQKLMRAVIGNNNVDNCSRLCHAPSAAGLVAAFGLSGGTNSSTTWTGPTASCSSVPIPRRHTLSSARV